MTIDPKYQSLPYLATGQDVYETSDLPESEQAYVSSAYSEEPSDNIERPNLNVKTGKQQFKNAHLEIDDAHDFSDNLGKERKIKIQSAEHGEAIDEDEVTSPSVVDRYQRLLQEIARLKADLDSGKAGLISSDQPVSADQLKELVGALEKQLEQHKLHEILGPDAKGLALDTQGSIQKALHSQADVIKESKSKRSASESTSSQKPPHNVVYEIYHSSDAEKLESLEKLSVLDERLRRLETVLGAGADNAKLSTLTGNTAHKGLLEAAAKMSQASALLDRSHLDQLEARLTALSNRLGQMAERQSELDADTQNRMASLYSLVKQHEKMADSLPSIVDRLTSLQSLHEDALHFSQTLSELDSRQQMLTMNVKSHCAMLKDMEDSFGANLKILDTNCEKMNERLKTLGK